MLVELLLRSAAVAVNPPTAFTATTISSTRIDLGWTNATAFLQVEVYRNGSLYDTVPAGTTSYSDLAISAGLEYTYKIRHKSGPDYSVFTSSITRSGVPPAPVLSVPSVVTDDVSLLWSQPATSQTEVRVYRDGSLLATLSAGATTYTDSNRPNGTYAYTIRNYNGVTESADSNSQNATVSYNPPLTDPSGFTATATHSDRNALAWTNGDATAQTEVYRGTSPSPTTLVATVSAGLSAYNDDGLDQATHYYYRIRHVKGGSISGYVSDDETTLTTTVSLVNIEANETLDDVILTWTLSNPPVTPVVNIGSWSDTGGFETAGTVGNVTSPVTVVTYTNGIVAIHTGTDVTGTLTYLRVYPAGRPTYLLAELTNVTADFSVGAA